MKRLTDTVLSKLLFRAGLVLAAAAVAALVYLARFPDTWSDEAFTLSLVRRPLFDILRLTARDVHPPLYYILLKLFLIVTKPFLPVVPAAKLFSVLPYAGICVLAATRVRRMYGGAAAGLFLILLHAVPAPVAYALEIRMYSLAAFFVFGGFLSAAAYLQDHEEKRLKGLVAWTLAASYTHYYACIAMAAAFLWILADALRRDGGKGGSRSDRRFPGNAPWKAAGITLALYLPWIIVLMGQLKTLSGGYWIDPVTRYTLLLYARFALGTRGMMWVLALLLLAGAFTRPPRRKEALLYLSGIALVLIVGVGVSILFKPVFVDRYLLPALPAALLGCAVFITAPADESSGTKPAVRRALPILTLAGSLFFLITSVTEVRNRIREEREVNALFAPTLDWAQTLTEDDIVITTNRHINEEMAFLSPARCYVVGEEESALMREVYGNAESVPQQADSGAAAPGAAIAPLLTRAQNVYFLDYEVAPYPGVEEALQGSKIKYERTSELFIEGPVTIYKLH